MKLVIGGRGAGKLEFVKNTYGYSESDITDGDFGDGAVLYNLQNIADLNEDNAQERLLGYEVIICDEIGCGIVPLDANAREMREKIGRICVMLARHATDVIRVYCGIATAIKGEI